MEKLSPQVRSDLPGLQGQFVTDPVHLTFSLFTGLFHGLFTLFHLPVTETKLKLSLTKGKDSRRISTRKKEK